MFEGGPNPTKVQAAPIYKRTAPPLILMHDGGGTTFSYFMLGALGRDVYAIHNPNFFDGSIMEGGMDAMARHYIGLIDKAGIRGPVILGGWSLGGYLSLTMSRMLADDPAARIQVVGMLIVDSPHHIPRHQIKDATVDPDLKGLPDLVQKAFDNCDVMLEHWPLPSWDAPAGSAKMSQVSIKGRIFDLRPDKALYKPIGADWKTIDHRIYQHDGEPKASVTGKLVAPPPAVLIRCVDHVQEPAEGEKPTMIDLHRKETMLGWEGRYPDFIQAVIDTGSNHYNVFERTDSAKIKTITAQMNEGLEILDSLAKPKPKAKPQRPMMEYF
jgi:pimeloyl-ACP methyl ester carboxylesterase